jgi:hypothetical protein
VVSTEGKRRAIALARGLKLPTGRSVAMDRGDIDDQRLSGNIAWHKSQFLG